MDVLSKRGQFSIEFFVVLTFFVLVLLWFNNYYNDLRSQDLVFMQQKQLVKQIALLEGESFSQNQTLYFDLPCLVSEGKAFSYWVYGGSVYGGEVRAGTNQTTLLVVLRSTGQSENSSFAVSAFPNPLVFECSGGSAGRIFFRREKVLPFGGGAAVDGVLLGRG
ncbi:MAG: hypothetical protein QXR53_00185 [Candidatus Norongarragalinales archaeon]